jgi:hypothetical protein
MPIPIAGTDLFGLTFLPKDIGATYVIPSTGEVYVYDGTSLVKTSPGGGLNFADGETVSMSDPSHGTLAHAPDPAASLLLMLAPDPALAQPFVPLQAGVNYALGGSPAKGITLVVDLGTNESLRAWYRYTA